MQHNKKTQKYNTRRVILTPVSGFWLCQKSKNPSRSFSSAGGTIQTKMDLEHWKQCRRTFWTEEREGLWLPNRWTLAANKEVYEATNQPQCYFFWWVPLKLPSRLLKEACLTGTLAFQVENEQKVLKDKIWEKKQLKNIMPIFIIVSIYFNSIRVSRILQILLKTWWCKIWYWSIFDLRPNWGLRRPKIFGTFT